MSIFSSPRSAIGIDIGSRWIKAVQVQRVRNGVRMVAAAALPQSCPDNPLASETLSKLRDILDRQGFSGSRVIAAVPVNKLEVEVLELPPRSSGAPVDHLARMEICRVAKLQPDAIEVASWDLPGSARGAAGGAMMVVAARHEDCNQIADALELASLDVIALDTPAWAMLRACRPLINASGITAIADLGWSGTLLALANGRNLIYKRLMPEAALSLLHRSIVQELEVPEQAADQLLHQHTLHQHPDVGNSRVQWLQSLIQQYHQTLLAELEASFAYANHRYPTLPISKLLLSGGACSKELCPILNERLGIPVSIAAPAELAEVTSSTQDHGDNAALTRALGLAMYEFDDEDD